MRTLIILVAIIVLFLIFRTWSKSSPEFSKIILKRVLMGAGVGLFILLLVTGRMSWLFALVAATIPVLLRVLPLLLRNFSLLQSLHRKYQDYRSGNSQTSTIHSPYFDISLNQNTGEMDGTILQGQYQGHQLSSLSLDVLLGILSELNQDNESRALLYAYLDKSHKNWRNHKHAQANHKPANNNPGDMTEQQALEILGLKFDANRDDIVKTHRKLMQKLHPDQGGSTYLAAKINLAKDHLLKNR